MRAVGPQSASRTAAAPISRSSSGATTCGGARGAVRGCWDPPRLRKTSGVHGGVFPHGPRMPPRPQDWAPAAGDRAPLPRAEGYSQPCPCTLSAVSPSSSRGAPQPDPKPGRGAQLLNPRGGLLPKAAPSRGAAGFSRGFADVGTLSAGSAHKPRWHLGPPGEGLGLAGRGRPRGRPAARQLYLDVGAGGDPGPCQHVLLAPTVSSWGRATRRVPPYRRQQAQNAQGVCLGSHRKWGAGVFSGHPAAQPGSQFLLFEPPGPPGSWPCATAARGDGPSSEALRPARAEGLGLPGGHPF